MLDCEWCVLDSDGVSFLKQPFCSTQRVCFAGVLGASTPYHDEIKGEAYYIFSTKPPQLDCFVRIDAIVLVSKILDVTLLICRVNTYLL